MKGVRFCDREKYQEVTENLQAALNSFDLLKLKNAITRACGPSNQRFVLKEDKTEGTVLPHTVVKACEQYYKKVDFRLQSWTNELNTKLYEDLNASNSATDANAINKNAAAGGEGAATEAPVVPRGRTTLPKHDPKLVTHYRDVVSFDVDCSISLKFSAIPFQTREFPAKPLAVLLKKEVVLKLLQFLKKTFFEQMYLPYAIEYRLWMPKDMPKGVTEQQWKVWHKQLATNRVRVIYKQLSAAGGSSADVGATETWNKLFEPEPRLVTTEAEQGIVLRRLWPQEFYPPKRTFSKET